MRQSQSRAEFELELGPLGHLRQGDRRFRVAPAVIGNYGFAENHELVVQGQRQVAIDPEAGQPKTSIVENGIFIKQVLRQGAMQEREGPSVAMEYGVLLPPVNGKGGTGVSVAGIVSHRTEAISLHLNAAAAITREHEPDLFLGAILEGPSSWPVRPVRRSLLSKRGEARGWYRTSSVRFWRAREGAVVRHRHPLRARGQRIDSRISPRTYLDYCSEEGALK
jgi:hypothetical protein